MTLLVLDTNVALDWLVFRDAVTAPALDALAASGRLDWIASDAMRGEFESVLRRGLRSRPALGADAAQLAWLRHARIVDPGPPAGGGWLCRDPDDQGFLELALSRPGSWLLTRDRALLVFARRAAGVGVGIATPAQWLQRNGTLSIDAGSLGRDG